MIFLVGASNPIKPEGLYNRLKNNICQCGHYTGVEKSKQGDIQPGIGHADQKNGKEIYTSN